MANALPPELVALFAAQDPAAKDTAWEAFVSLHSRLLLHAARTLGKDYDGAMDRYSYALERLQEHDFRRLRGYRPDGRTKFTTWLVVVFRRLCLDHYRQRYGRSPRSDRPQGSLDERHLRRQLANGLMGGRDPQMGGRDPQLVEAPGLQSPELEMTSRQRSERLAAALSALPAADRLLLKFRFEDDLSANEIAKAMGLPTPFHVYRRLNALFLSLRRSLRAAGVDGPDG
jgi:RNA polymerase sigma factor (sigma-70 family)